MRKNILYYLTILFGLYSVQGNAQDSYNVLFIGNSYTGVNNLPQLVSNIAGSKGDNIQFDSHTPGGNTFEQHSVNPAAITKISAGNWDYVVLQEQSQKPSFSPMQVSTDVYPFAKKLCDTIRFHNPCATPLFYMTWGRQDGDASNCDGYPPVCTYEGMQERLTASYTEMADDNDYAAVAPVGEAWKSIRATNPEINLYSGDGSHPSIHGSYLAACVFYTSIFKKTCVGAAHPTSISDEEAAILETAAYNTVFKRFDEWYFPYITTNIVGDQVTYGLQTNGPSTITEWSFVNNQTSTEDNPSISYDANVDNEATVNFQYDTCIDAATISTIVDISVLSISENNAIDLIQLNGNVYQINNSNAQETFVRIYTTNGQLVLEKNSKALQINIDMSGLSSGTYLINVISNQKQASKKLVILE